MFLVGGEEGRGGPPYLGSRDGCGCWWAADELQVRHFMPFRNMKLRSLHEIVGSSITFG